MVLLRAPFWPYRARGAATPWTPGLLAGGIAAALALSGWTVGRLGGWPGGLGLAVASAATHAGLLVVAWSIAVGNPPRWTAPSLRIAAVLFLASVASRVSAWGAVLYLGVPPLLLCEGRRAPGLDQIGLGLNAGLKAVVLGLAAGAFLGAHVLISAALTLGYGIRGPALGQYLAAAAYDIGANALTAELLFRGALFSRWWSRWEFWPAAALSTAVAVCRYIFDPALPAAIEVRVGTVFYMSLLGVTACALRAASGCLLPGYLAAVTFFLAYRLLTQ